MLGHAFASKHSGIRSTCLCLNAHASCLSATQRAHSATSRNAPRTASAHCCAPALALSPLIARRRTHHCAPIARACWPAFFSSLKRWREQNTGAGKAGQKAWIRTLRVACGASPFAVFTASAALAPRALCRRVKYTMARLTSRRLYRLVPSAAISLSARGYTHTHRTRTSAHTTHAHAASHHTRTLLRAHTPHCGRDNILHILCHLFAYCCHTLPVSSLRAHSSLCSPSLLSDITQHATEAFYGHSNGAVAAWLRRPPAAGIGRLANPPPRSNTLFRRILPLVGRSKPCLRQRQQRQ